MQIIFVMYEMKSVTPLISWNNVLSMQTLKRDQRYCFVRLFYRFGPTHSFPCLNFVFKVSLHASSSQTGATWLTKGGMFNIWEEICSIEDMWRKRCGKKHKFVFRLVYSTHKKQHREFGLNWNVYIMPAQAASSSLFEPVLSVYCLAAQDLRAGAEQKINCLITQNR